MAEKEPEQKRQQERLSDEDVRQGRMVLTTRIRRAIFIAGLIGFVVMAVVARIIWVF